MPRTSMSLATVAAVVAAVALPASAAHADVIDVWTTYASMSACKANPLNDFCNGLADGRTIGYIDAALTLDHLDNSLGLPYDDESTLPAPEGPDNPVVEVWNNTGSMTYIAPGTSLVGAARAGETIYYVPAHADAAGPAVDADVIQLPPITAPNFTSSLSDSCVGSGSMSYFLAGYGSSGPASQIDVACTR